jgi:hypothetical protein
MEQCGKSDRGSENPLLNNHFPPILDTRHLDRLRSLGDKRSRVQISAPRLKFLRRQPSLSSPHPWVERRKSHPRSAPSTSPTSGAKGTSVAKLTRTPTASPIRAPATKKPQAAIRQSLHLRSKVRGLCKDFVRAQLASPLAGI